MITIFILIIIWGIVSIIKTELICRSKGAKFNPFLNNNFFWYMGTIVGGIAIISLIFYLILTYLP